ncbi:capsular biosynthesis protein [Pseudomonas benzenivorans]|uniref:Capsular polysaccharide export protein n=1 Tax=Pseudomonas benzenivorans TaxID=556533 RepID=A0ABY5H881_9PSED|nr:capsular biosynthesis protein [Pseudomonas benzenivorans]UTW07490.1 hypothetical protein KDW96_20470 [Pseudomonas benzenivorans]
MKNLDVIASVICYVRPWNADQFATLAKNIFPEASIYCCSEHARVDSLGLKQAYYSNLKDNIREVEADITADEAQDMIVRCRLLRKLPFFVAQKHLFAMAAAIKGILERKKPQVVLSLTVDSYVIDLLRHLSVRQGVRFVALVPSFVNGYFRVTSRGESTLNPGYDLSIIDDLRHKLLDPLYTPSFNVSALSNPNRGVFKRWVANLARVPYFFAKRYFSGDRFNFHYWASQLVSWEQFSIFLPREPGNPNWEQVLASDSRPALYIPLQMFPECTVDYWSEDAGVIDYYAALERFIEKHHVSFNIVVKEHPSVMGARPSGFYRKIKKDARITVVPTYTPSNLVLDKVQGVFIWTGTVGFESALRGKAVITLCNPYYAYGKRFLKITEQTPSEVLLDHVKAMQILKVTNCEQEELLANLVEQLFPGSFKNNGAWDSKNVRDLEDLQDMVRALTPLLML